MFDKTKNLFHLCYIMQNTKSQYNEVIKICRTIFLKKNADYGTSWRLFRPSSLTDQIYIKAQRIKNIEESGNNVVGDDIKSVFHKGCAYRKGLRENTTSLYPLR